MIDTKTLGIKKVYIDSIDHSVLHIIVSDSISFNQKVALSYIPGSITSSDSLKLGTLSGFTVNNNLTETKVSKVYVDKSGLSVYFNFNKFITKPQDFSEIKVFDNNNNILQIDSFKYLPKSSIQVFLKSVVLKNDTIYVTLPAIVSGQDGVVVTSISHFQVINNSTVVSIKKEVSDGIEIFPNPASQQIVNYKIPEEVHGNVIAELFDIQGKLVFQQKLLKSEGVIDLRNLTRSKSYILKISFLNKTYQKIILL